MSLDVEKMIEFVDNDLNGFSFMSFKQINLKQTKYKLCKNQTNVEVGKNVI